MSDKPLSNAIAVKKYLEKDSSKIQISQFREEWKQLTDKDREELGELARKELDC